MHARMDGRMDNGCTDVCMHACMGMGRTRLLVPDHGRTRLLVLDHSHSRRPFSISNPAPIVFVSLPIAIEFAIAFTLRRSRGRRRNSTGCRIAKDEDVMFTTISHY